MVNLLTICFQAENLIFFPSFFFVSFYKMAEFVVHNYVRKTQTATTGTRPLLVASQYMSQEMSNVPV